MTIPKNLGGLSHSCPFTVNRLLRTANSLERLAAATFQRLVQVPMTYVDNGSGDLDCGDLILTVS